MTWANDYVGLPYREDFDCVHLVFRVQSETFGRNYSDPDRDSNNYFGLSAQIDRQIDHYFDEVTEPEDGDVVLIRCNNRLNHMGVYVNITNVPYVLHNLRSIGSVALHRVRDLPKWQMVAEGFYRFKKDA